MAIAVLPLPPFAVALAALAVVTLRLLPLIPPPPPPPPAARVRRWWSAGLVAGEARYTLNP